MNPARLAELHRQRELVLDQLGWLDREIAREGTAFIPVDAVKALETPPLPRLPPMAELTGESVVYSPNPVATAAEARRGCILAIIAGFVVIVAALTAIYFLRYRGLPLI